MANHTILIKKHLESEDSSYTYNKSKLERLYNHNNFNIGRYFLTKNSFFYVTPLDDPEMVKSYTVLEGSCLDLQSREVFSQGDVFVIKGASEILSFHILEETLLLIHEQSSDSVGKFKDSSAEMIHLLSELQLKDNYTKEHSDRVFELAKYMGLALEYSAKKIFNLNKASRFHDIGKIYIEDHILNKPDKLNDEEFDKIKKHVQLGKDLIIEKFDQEVFDIIIQHHERIDGSGYPYGLKGDQILEEAKVLAICDSFDAMTTDRVYKKGKTHEEAFDELIQLAGSQYDKSLVTLFVSLFKDKF